MYKVLKNAYYNGWRAGMTNPVLYVVNGNKYVSQPQCPYQNVNQFIMRWVWHFGKDNGQWRRLLADQKRRAF